MPFKSAWKPIGAAAFGFLAVSCMTANDTGGMIPWSPANEAVALAQANDHCARYGRYAVITSIHPWPGDYIGFVCRIPNRYGPLLR
jgi:hypothetical protein